MWPRATCSPPPSSRNVQQEQKKDLKKEQDPEGPSTSSHSNAPSIAPQQAKGKGHPDQGKAGGKGYPVRLSSSQINMAGPDAEYWMNFVAGATASLDSLPPRPERDRHLQDIASMLLADEAAENPDIRR